MKLQTLLRAAMMTAVVAAMAVVPPLYLPLSPVPITIQTLGVMLAGSLLGPRGGFLSMLVFLVLLAAGLPVLSGGRGGAAHLVGPSAGYILAFPVAALAIGLLARRRGGSSSGFGGLLLANLVGGVLLVHALGAPVLALLTDRSLKEALVAGVIVYLPGDVMKAVAASGLALVVRRALGWQSGSE